jgi:branched-chain amino acid aminotransferase
MLSAMPEPQVFLQGEMMPRSAARVPVGDHSFRYGEGVFETLRGRGEHVFRARRHLGRLRASAAALYWPLPWTEEELLDGLARMLRANGLPEARVRIQAGPGVGTRDARGNEPLLLMEAERFVPVPEEVRRAGVSLQVWLHRRPRGGGMLAHAKTSSYLENLLARRIAREAGAYDALFLDQDGWACETSCANLFAVHGGAVRTPPASCGVLEGVTRQVMLEILSVAEEPLTLEQLRSADEIFLTSTGVEVLPVTWLDGAAVGAGRPGPVCREAARSYRRILDDELSAAC